ncbi:retrovirus-related pol polyprotein from transposon TNT 1-94 [Tanacetum coccineum]
MAFCVVVNSSAQQDALILSVIEQLKTQVTNCTKINLDNKSVNDTLTAELERYKEQSVEIDRLKQTFSEHLKESLMQTVTLLKNDFKKEESKNINREIALEKKIKQLDNIVYKRDQPTQTKAQQLEPKLYDGNVIKNTSAIVIPDSKETLMLAEESRSKMILTRQDPYVNSMNSSDPNPSCRPTIVEVLKELPKVSMINTSLKKLKHHLTGFDVVVKERTTATTITEGSWGIEHTKAYFRDQIIPFVKALKDLFNTFDQYLIDELSEVQNVFHQMEQDVEQHPQSQEKDTVIKKLKERIKSLSGSMNEDKVKKDIEEIETINIELEHMVSKLIAKNEHLKQTYKKLYDSIKPTRIRSKEQTLKDELGELKGKYLADNVVTKQTITPEMLKIDVEPIAPKLLNNKTTHSYYLKHTQEQATILREVVEQGKSQNPLNNPLNSAYNHDLCVLDFINDVNAHAKSKSTFTIVGNACPLTRITTTTEVPLRKPIALESDTHKPVVTLVYSRKPRKSKTNVPVSKPKIIKSISANKKEPSKSWGSIVSDVPSSSLDEFRSSKLFSEGDDLLIGSRGNNLYTLSLGDMTMSSPICLLSKASKTKPWLWHRLLSHLNFGAINHLARHGLVRGLPKLKFEKDHLCSAVYLLMASEHSSLEPALHKMTPVTISSGLMPSPPPLTPFVPPSRTDWDILFQPLFDELLNPPSSVDRPTPKVIAPIAEVVALEPVASTGSPSSTTVDQDAPSSSNSQTTPKTQSLVISNDVEEENHDIDLHTMNNIHSWQFHFLENDSEALFF